MNTAKLKETYPITTKFYKSTRKGLLFKLNDDVINIIRSKVYKSKKAVEYDEIEKKL